MLREVIIDDERIAAGLEEFLTHRATGVRRNVLKSRRFIRGCDDDDGVLHRPVLLEDAKRAGHSSLLLADGNVDTDQVFPLLVDDRVYGESGFSRLAIADDELALTAADRDHGVD